MLRLYHSTIFWQLLKTELTLIKSTLRDKIINATIWSVCTIGVAAFILPLFGITNSYGLIQALSVVVSIAIFELFASFAKFFADIEGENHLSYRLTLPIPSWLVFVNMALVFTINSLLLGFCALVVAKLVLWNSFNLSLVNIPALLITFVVNNLFFGFFGLFMISMIKGLMSLGNMWMRILYPLWFLGGFQFTWYSLYQVSPSFAYASLLNPYVYAQEGFRASILGQTGSLPIWACVAALLGMTVLCAGVSVVRLKRRLDFV